MNNTKALNSLKGFAACIVAFVWHYQHFAPQAGSPLYSLFTVSYQHGWLMVELFFMLSGFGMMMGYGEKVINHTISFKEYIGRRLKKLYPLFFLTLLLVTVLEWIYKAKVGETFVYPNFDIYHFILNVLCLQNGFLGTEWSFNSPSWCISICMFLYIVFFVVAYFSKSRVEVVYKFGVLVFVGAGILISAINYPIFNGLMARGLVCFSIGVILAEVFVYRDKFCSGVLGYIFLLLLIGIYIVLRNGNYEATGNVHLLFIFGIAPMLILSVLFVPWLNKLLSYPVFTCLGSISMEIYLFHFLVQCGIKIADVYGGLSINYSTKSIWFLYTGLTMAVSAFYKAVLEKRYRNMFFELFKCK